MNRALSFDVTDDLSYRKLGRDRDMQMHMVRTQTTFQYQTLTLPRQFSYHFPEILPNSAIEHLPTALRYPDNVINAQEFLGNEQIEITDVVDARVTRIDENAAWDMFKSAASIPSAKGKKVLRFEHIADDKDVILTQVMGPSGNLRAPTYRVGNAFVVGFNPGLYADYAEWVK